MWSSFSSPVFSYLLELCLNILGTLFDTQCIGLRLTPVKINTCRLTCRRSYLLEVETGDDTIACLRQTRQRVAYDVNPLRAQRVDSATAVSCPVCMTSCNNLVRIFRN